MRGNKRYGMDVKIYGTQVIYKSLPVENATTMLEIYIFNAKII